MENKLLRTEKERNGNENEFCNTIVDKEKPAINSGEKIENFATTWEERNWK